MEGKQVEAHITHDDGFCALLCRIVWQPELTEAGRADFLATLAKEFDRIMKGKT